MSKSRKKKYKRNTLASSINNYLFIALLFTVGIIPLLVRITPIEYDLSTLSWYTGQVTFYDTFSYIKANAIKGMGIVMTLLLAINLYHNASKSTFKSPVLILAVLSATITVISSINSAYPYFVFNGFLERYESIWVALSYSVFFISAYILFWDAQKISIFTNIFWGLNVILSLIGLGQMFGKNIITDPNFVKLISSSKIDGVFSLEDTTAALNVISQTLYHYNYVGFFIALSLPYFASLALFEQSLKKKLALAATSLLILVNLLASSARGGLVGVLVGTVFWLVLNRDHIFKNKRFTIIFFAIIAISFIGYETFSGGYVTTRLKQMVDIKAQPYQIQALYTDNNRIVLETDSGILEIIVDSRTENDWNFHAELNGEKIRMPMNDQSKMYFENDALHDIFLYYTAYENEPYYYLTLEAEGAVWPFKYEDSGKLLLRNPYGNYDVLSETNRVHALDGYEAVGSARIYIWSRYIPIVMAKPLLGYGPETAAVIFPQSDYLGKVHAYKTNNMVVDKPHNLYLQYAVNYGLLGLGVFLSLIIAFYLKTFKYLKRNQFKFESAIASALFVGLTSYFVAAMFNDSTVHVSPVFWVIFGMAFSFFENENSTSGR